MMDAVSMKAHELIKVSTNTSTYTGKPRETETGYIGAVETGSN